MFHVPFNIQRDCTYSIFRATCAEEGIICLHSWIEIYGLIRVPPNGRMDGVLDRLGHSKSLKKNYPNRSIIDLISSALNERIEVDRKKFVNRSFFLAIFLHPGQTNDIVSGIVDTQREYLFTRFMGLLFAPISLDDPGRTITSLHYLDE